jgi:hypothetical protein
MVDIVYVVYYSCRNYVVSNKPEMIHGLSHAGSVFSYPPILQKQVWEHAISFA